MLCQLYRTARFLKTCIKVYSVNIRFLIGFLISLNSPNPWTNKTLSYLIRQIYLWNILCLYSLNENGVEDGTCNFYLVSLSFYLSKFYKHFLGKYSNPHNFVFKNNCLQECNKAITILRNRCCLKSASKFCWVRRLSLLFQVLAMWFHTLLKSKKLIDTYLFSYWRFFFDMQLNKLFCCLRLPKRT